MADDSNTSADTRARRGSFTAQTFSAIFSNNNNTANRATNSPSTQSITNPFPSPINPTAPARRMSITTIGLGTSPQFSTANRRTSTASISNSDESAIEEDDGLGRSMPNTPFTRRMSIGAQAMFGARGGNMSTGTSPNGTRPPPKRKDSIPLHAIPDGAEQAPASTAEPALRRQASTSATSNSLSQASKASHARTPSDLRRSPGQESGMNWAEQFRSRAESRTSFSNAGGRPNLLGAPSAHERRTSVVENPAPAQTVQSPRESVMRKKPDEIGERMLRGEFYAN